MKAHRLRLLCTLLLITTTLTSVALAARYAREDPDDWPGVWYRIIFDENGDYVSGDGDGDGWHHYDATSGVYRMWFYNGPYDPERKAQLDYYIYTEPTPEWSALGLSHPPLPINVPFPQDEAKYIKTEHLYTIPAGFFGSIEPIAHEIIEAYNPEWVSIDVTGNNVLVFRGAFHDCIGDEPGGGEPGGGEPGGGEPHRQQRRWISATRPTRAIPRDRATMEPDTSSSRGSTWDNPWTARPTDGPAVPPRETTPTETTMKTV